MELEYVTIQTIMAEDFSYLTDEEAGKAIKAYLNYATSGESKAPEGNAIFVYLSLKREFDRVMKIREERAEAGRAGGRPKRRSLNRHSSIPKQSRSPKCVPLHPSSATKKQQKSSKAQTRCWTKRNGRDSPTRRRQWRRSTSLWRTTERKKFWNASKSPGKQENRIFDT